MLFPRPGIGGQPQPVVLPYINTQDALVNVPLRRGVAVGIAPPCQAADSTPVIHQCRQVQGSSSPYTHHANGLVMLNSEHWRTSMNQRTRLCTAEVRGSNPLGSTVENAVLQEEREPRIGSPTVSQAIVQSPTCLLVVGVPPRSALADLTEPWGARRGRWRRTARSPSPRSGRRRALCQSSTSRATRVCPSPRARGRWTRRGSWWQVAQRDHSAIATGERPVVQHANTRLHQ